VKILVATEETQGRRKNDFSWTKEGELVTFGSECTDETIDGDCGCRRSMSGVETGKATTTVRVVERESASLWTLANLLTALLVANGYYSSWSKARKPAIEDARDLAEIAGRFPEGTILERRGNRFAERRRALT
jgi:hypothetical protein